MRLLKKSLFWGLVGAVALLVASGNRIVMELDQVIQSEGTRMALPRLMGAVLVIGFICGFLSSLLGRLLGRFGWIGKAVIGAIMVPLFLFGFLFAFGEEAMEEYGNPTFLILGAVIGMIGVPIGFQGFKGLDEQV